MLRRLLYTTCKQVGLTPFSRRSNCNIIISRTYSDEKSVLTTPSSWPSKKRPNFNLKSVLTLQQNETLDSIQNINKLPDLLDFLKNNSNKIIVPHYAPIFVQIFHMFKSDSTGMSKEQFVKSPEFEKFCVKVKKTVRAIRPSDTLQILKTLQSLNVSTNSTLCQCLLQILSKSLNELDVWQIVFLSNILLRASPSPIVDALKMSSPIVFDAIVRNKLDTSNKIVLFRSLNFAAFNNVSQKSRDIIINGLWEHRENLTCAEAKVIVLRLCMIKAFNEDRRKLYKFCMDIINREVMKELTFDDICLLASSTINCFLKNHVFYYDELFLSNVSKYVLHHKLGFNECGSVLLRYNRISYVSIELLDYTDNILSKLDPEHFTDLSSLVAFIGSCVNARYEPPHWVLYKDKITNALLSNDSFSPYLVLKATVELTAMQCWHLPLIEKVFSEDFWNQIPQDGKQAHYRSILRLYQFVMTLYPGQYNGIMPLPHVIQKAKDIMNEIERDNIIQPALEKLFGGENFVVNGLTTKLGHYIDSLIVLRKDGSLHPLKEHGVKDGQHLEDIRAPRNSHFFAILLQKPTSYCFHGIRLKGISKSYIDSIETLGVIAVPLSENVWESLEDHEKLPFLKREIFSRIPDTDDWFQIIYEKLYFNTLEEQAEIGKKFLKEMKKRTETEQQLEIALKLTEVQKEKLRKSDSFTPEKIKASTKINNEEKKMILEMLE